MLRWRILLGTLLIAGLAGLLWLDFHSVLQGMWLMPLALAVSLAACGELLWLLEAHGLHPQRSVVYGGNFLIVLSNAAPLLWVPSTAGVPLVSLAWPLAAFTLVFLWGVVGEIWRYERPGGVIVNLALAVFSLAYIGLLMSFILQLRWLSGGSLAVLAFLVVVKAGDTGAYFIGRLFGSHKMTPTLSPGKTIEGAAGAIVFSCLGAWIVLQGLRPELSGTSEALLPWGWLVFGVAVGVAGIVGDLAESLLKRDMGRKDSGSWLPGFGGVLDLIDSLLVAAPVAYVCWLAIGPGSQIVNKS